MFGATRYPQGWRHSGQPRSGTWGGAGDPWHLIRIQAEPDPSANAYGLLELSLAEEPKLPRAGLLSQCGTEGPLDADPDALPMPDRKPTPPSQYKMRPGVR